MWLAEWFTINPHQGVGPDDRGFRVKLGDCLGLEFGILLTELCQRDRGVVNLLSGRNNHFKQYASLGQQLLATGRGGGQDQVHGGDLAAFASAANTKQQGRRRNQRGESYRNLFAYSPA